MLQKVLMTNRTSLRAYGVCEISIKLTGCVHVKLSKYNYCLFFNFHEYPLRVWLLELFARTSVLNTLIGWHF